MVKVYVPYTSTPKPEIPTEQVPTYPDKGISYAGYSKTLVGQGRYQLNPQTPFDTNIISTPAAGTTLINFNLSPSTDKDHYITDLFFIGLPSAFTTISLADYATGKIFFSTLNNMFTPNGFYVHFSVPIKVSSRVLLTLYAPSVAGDQYVTNIYGWYE